MSRNWARIFGGVLTVAGIWIAAYWWLNPGQPKISFGATVPTTQAKAPQPLPRPAPKLADINRETAPVRISDPVRPPSPPAARPEAMPPAKSKPADKPTVKPAPMSPAVIPPKFSDYTVKANDTLTSISTKALGSVKHIDAIRRANPLKDLDKIKAGDVIRIPLDPDNIQGKPPPNAPAPTPPAERQGEMLEYTVQNGDTLSKIAKDKYGSTSYQDLIYQANRDRLASPNSLKEGQKLRLPPKPKQ